MERQGKSLFTKFARHAANVTGRPITFIVAVLIIVSWAFLGPFFGVSDSWQLVINTSTIITFLMVILIQNTQNRDTEALQIKLDEMIRSIKGARNVMKGFEEMDEKGLNRIVDEYLGLAEHERLNIERGEKAHAKRRSQA